MKIGIGITTHNRREVAAVTVREWQKRLPNDAKLVIVDDGSERPYPNADFRFENARGIAKAKNKCLELLEDCEHIFLSDDDLFPIDPFWYKPYLNNSQPHLCYTFTQLADGRPNGRTYLGSGEDYRYFEAPCGCLLYVRNHVLQAVGGMDIEFVKWGYEHVEWSQRIHNAGHTAKPFMDAFDTDRLWFSYDKQCRVQGSVPERKLYSFGNWERWQMKKHDKHFKPYKGHGKND